MSQAKSIYICENCGITVQPENYYGSGRFCCAKCARSFSSRYANTEEKRKQKSETEKQTNKIKREKLYKENIDVINKILELSGKYNPCDIQSIVNVPYQQIKRILKEHNIDCSHYVRACDKSTINICKNILKKDTSITYEDLEKVKEIISKHIFEDNIPPQDIAVMYNHNGKPEGFSGFLRNCLHMKIKNLSEAVVSYNERIGYYDNLTEREKYYKECTFTFNPYIYEHILGYDLLKKYSWYNTKDKIDGLARDHRISRDFGFNNNVNPKLISHPANCEIMLQSDNSTKKEKCSITLEELKEQVKEWDTKYGVYNQEIYDEHLLD